MSMFIREVERGDVEGVRQLMKGEGTVNFAGTVDGVCITPLCMASKKGHTEVVRLLLERGADIHGLTKSTLRLYLLCVRDCTSTPLYCASQGGHTEVVKLLLDHGADVNTNNKDDGKTPLHIASHGGHSETVKVLLDHGAIVKEMKCGITPLLEASSEGHTEVVKLLLDHGADANITATNERGLLQTPLLKAVLSGHTEVVKLLLDHGADANLTAREEWTPLHNACGLGHTEVVKLLLEHGADTNARCSGHTAFTMEHGADTIYGRTFMHQNMPLTPIHVACSEGHPEVVKILLEHGVAANIANEGGWTPFHCAVHSYKLEIGYCTDVVKIIQLLLVHSADINAQTKLEDATPLHIVSTGKNLGSKEVVKVLLNNGADVNLMNAHGKTAVDIAEYNHSTVTKLLLHHQQSQDKMKDETKFQELQKRLEESQKQVEELKKIQQLEAASSHGHQNPKLEERPTLQQFQCLKWVDEKGTKRRIYIMRNVASDWRQLGIALRFSSAELDTIEAGRSDNVVACTEKLFGLWEKKGENFSWKGLIEALKDADLVNLASDLEKALFHDQTTEKEQ